MLNKNKIFYKIAILFSAFVVISCQPSVYFYSHLNIMKGLEVYTHVISENKYEFAFMSGTNMYKKAGDVNRLIYVNLQKARRIINSYNNQIDESNLIIIIIPNPCTDEDLINSKENAYIVKEVKKLLLEIE